MKEREYRPPAEKIEINLGSDADLENLRERLAIYLNDDAAEQLIFVLKSMAKDDFVNRCNDATCAFGELLATKFGEEESFFELAPSATFADARAYERLDNIGYDGNYHSVAVISVKEKGKQNLALTLDLTYGNVAHENKRQSALVLLCPGTETDALASLARHYGGQWKIEFRYNRKTNKISFV